MIARLFALTVVLAAVCTPFSAARGQDRFTRNNYTVDLVTGPVLGGGRVVGMAGAYSAIASGIDGAVFNPAGYAERYEKEIDFFAWDVTGGLWLSGVFARNDFDNNGAASSNGNGKTLQLTLGLRLQFSDFGSGVNWTGRLYQLRDENGGNFDVVLQTLRAGSGYSFMNGGLVAGFTVTKFDLALSAGTGGNTLTTGGPLTRVGSDAEAKFSGIGGEVGVLVRPAYERYRLGIVARTPIAATLTDTKMLERDANGAQTARGLVLPELVHVPWELTFGFAYQFGERRTNTPWRNTNRLRSALRKQIQAGTYELPETYGERPYQALPEDPRKALDVAMANYREAERRLRRHQPRRYVLISADFILYGKTAQGHGIDSFLNQTPERSGQKVSYGARAGIESEIWPDRVKVRAGTYIEPSRFKRSYYRPHGTAGFDVRLFDLWRWSVRGTATIDLAPRYFNYGIAFGLWW